jgi:hypothetical protein
VIDRPPPPYARRRKRFGWDKSGVVIDGAVYPNVLDVSAGWTGPVGNVTDPADSGLTPWDTTPADATMIVNTNGAIAPIQFGFPALASHEGGRFKISVAGCTVIGGVLEDTPDIGKAYLEIYSGTSPQRIHFSREILFPRSGIAGGEYEFLDGDIFNPPVNLADVSVRITPTSFMSGKGYGLGITYLHIRGVTV